MKSDISYINKRKELHTFICERIQEVIDRDTSKEDAANLVLSYIGNELLESIIIPAITSVEFEDACKRLRVDL